VLCVREDRVGGRTLRVALLGLLAAAALLVAGSVASRLGVARVVMAIRFPDIPRVAMPAAVFREEAALRPAPDPALEERLREVQEALAKAWRAGQEDAGFEAENDPTGGAATAAASGAPAIATTTATANPDPPAATTTATANPDPSTATTMGTVDASPPAATAVATAAPPSANPSTAPIASAAASPAAPAATALAVVAPLTPKVTVPADASPSDIHVIVYTASWCDVCKRAEAWMIQRGIAFEERDITASAEYQQELLQLNPGGAVPTFNVDGNVRIGFDARWLLVTVRRAVRRSEGVAL
jgi:glutaredoxin